LNAPRWWIERLQKEFPAQWREVLATQSEPPPLVLRINARHTSPEAYLHRLREENLDAIRVGVDAIWLKQARSVDAIPGFARGDVSVQDAGSQLAAHWLDVRAGQRVLDACAAPGGKSGALLELAGGELALTALDSDGARLRRVADNLQRLRREARLVHADLRATPDWWDGQPFDAILLDAPCSGTGVIRRHPDIKLLRRASDTAAFAALQLELLKACWALLRPGGRLLYATCSVLPAENSAVIGAFLAAEPTARALELALPAGLVPPLRNGRPGGQRLPGAGGDGFYYACLAR